MQFAGNPPGQYRTQGYITASTNKGKSFGTIYSWDSKEYPQLGRGHMTAGPGEFRGTPTRVQAALSPPALWPGRTRSNRAAWAP
jgi:hypothetical protein